MKNNNEMTSLQMFVNLRSHKERLLHFFPVKKAQMLQAAPKTFSSDFSSLLSSKNWSRRIHYSWFYEEIKTYPKELINSLLPILSSEQKKGLSEMLNFPKESKKISAFAIAFLMSFLKKRIVKEPILFLEGLPESQMNVLLKLEKKELTNVIDLLGVYDLAADLRQIVDKELLGKIYAALGQNQLQFLHYASRQPMKWVSPKLNLERWNGSKKSLENLLHQRGLVRLARAIFNESQDYKWHLLHLLDTGRANFIQKIFAQKLDESLVSYFKGQVLHILERYQPL